MSDQLQAFRNSVSDGYDAWRSQVTLPWVAAYAAAYDDYQSTLQGQKDLDKDTAELFVTVLSVVSGTFLMATLAQSSLRILAGEAALQVVCNHNLTSIFTLMEKTASNKAAMFAIGGFSTAPTIRSRSRQSRSSRIFYSSTAVSCPTRRLRSSPNWTVTSVIVSCAPTIAPR